MSVNFFVDDVLKISRNNPMVVVLFENIHSPRECLTSFRAQVVKEGLLQLPTINLPKVYGQCLKEH